MPPNGHTSRGCRPASQPASQPAPQPAVRPHQPAVRPLSPNRPSAPAGARTLRAVSPIASPLSLQPALSRPCHGPVTGLTARSPVPSRSSHRRSLAHGRCLGPFYLPVTPPGPLPSPRHAPPEPPPPPPSLPACLPPFTVRVPARKTGSPCQRRVQDRVSVSAARCTQTARRAPARPGPSETTAPR